MNARYYAHSLLLLLGIMIFGCKSNPSSPGSGAPSVKISPSQFHGIWFEVDTFQAKIQNHDFAETYFQWDMGDSTLISNAPPYSFQAVHAYSKPGSYKIRVQAFDIYTNNVIAADSMIAVIDTAKISVEIVPQFYYGTLTTNTLGVFDPFSLSVKCSIPATDLYQFWDFGDGTTDSFISGASTHMFQHPGSYLLKVDIYQKNGTYVGSDTALVSIDLPAISLNMLKQATRVEEVFYVDSSYAQFSPARTSLPFVMSLHFQQDSLHVAQWNGNDFSIKFHGALNGIQDDSIGGKVSADLKSITALTGEVIVTFPSNNSGEYAFKATDLTLVGVTADHRIIFRVSKGDARNSLQLASLNVAGSFNITNLAHIRPDGGVLDNSLVFIPAPLPPDPVVVLVFDQN